jgi:hypothetical protein
MLAESDTHFRFEAPLAAGCAFLARHSTFSGWNSILALVVPNPAARHFGSLTLVAGYLSKLPIPMPFDQEYSCAM